MDARIAKTRQRLQEALFELAREHGIDDISIGDIAQRAGVNRTTFYAHYRDKETLLADALDLVATRAGANLEQLELTPGKPPLPLVEFLGHVDEYADLYRRIFTAPGYGIVLARLRTHIIDAITRLIGEHSPHLTKKAPVEFVAAGIAGSLLGMIGTWLDSEPRTDPTQAARWMWAVVPGASDRR